MSGPKEAPDNLFITDWGHPESDGWFTKAWPGKAPNEAWADYTRTDICLPCSYCEGKGKQFEALTMAQETCLHCDGSGRRPAASEGGVIVPRADIERLANHFMSGWSGERPRHEIIGYIEKLARGWLSNAPKPPQPSSDARHFAQIFERDRSTVAEAVTTIKKIISGYGWLRHGRGSYEYNDDRWHDEFGAAIDLIETALEPLKILAGDVSECPVDRAEIIAARQSPDLALAHGDLIADLRAAHEHWTLHGYPEGSGTLFKIAADALESAPSLALAEFDTTRFCCFCGKDNTSGIVGYAGERTCPHCGKGGHGEPDEPQMAYKRNLGASPTVIEDFPGRKVEAHLRLFGKLPTAMDEEASDLALAEGDARVMALSRELGKEREQYRLLAEENRVLREALKEYMFATDELCRCVDWKDGARVDGETSQKFDRAEELARKALSTPSLHPHSQREEAFGEMLDGLKSLRDWVWDAANRKSFFSQAPDSIVALATEDLQRIDASIARAEACK